MVHCGKSTRAILHPAIAALLDAGPGLEVTISCGQLQPFPVGQGDDLRREREVHPLAGALILDFRLGSPRLAARGEHPVDPLSPDSFYQYFHCQQAVSFEKASSSHRLNVRRSMLGKLPWKTRSVAAAWCFWAIWAIFAVITLAA